MRPLIHSVQAVNPTDALLLDISAVLVSFCRINVRLQGTGLWIYKHGDSAGGVDVIAGFTIQYIRAERMEHIISSI
ncbi:hypothetical protein SERLA73DRAFT_182964 [Serpula lacrymans var. lacrymans S7.3]|uniref:Uncharacterized protein n=2 Tax=Serpula lacrymans var. lacrymans TaxID=341189 RepID=F8Q1C3_SERL3|nr:uncharacterized protein SERLADRAFT_469872 [Serpula lacrymans var. lacrymans S7.9]EGN98101.1 hypothetical protein SERLA73DRAFT_182964 [Serpula lacrymans var. lacrymans S7.3]EGO23682.1 hypothetical protein SERLADRAFT_469872 [Serpula lacrymans var. lacrymans S7.9]